ncbi:hypothetical protein EDB84DRAFT_1602640 [Lactarius hengduanensis]|nr:hypothetical protein EDB84DRAFT_1602640 [Lactarius hengduanensis]
MAQEPAENAPVVTQDGTVEVEEIEGLTPEEVFHSPARCAPASTLNDPCCAPNFCIPDAHDYPVHRTHLPCASLLADRYHPNLHYTLHVQVALCLYVQVAAVFPTHADVVAHQPHRTQAAEAASIGKTITVTELWKPHLGTSPLIEDLGLESVTAVASFLLLIDALHITALYPLADVNSALFTYVEKYPLVNRFRQQFINIRLDGVLAAALSTERQGHYPRPGIRKT